VPADPVPDQHELLSDIEPQLPPAVFVTGTDTNVGKTMVSAILCKGLGAGYWKPIQSGLQAPTDSEFMTQVAGIEPVRIYPEAYRLRQPLSPHASALADRVDISLDEIRLPEYLQKHLIVEGAGGVLVPLNRRELMIDLMVSLNLPVLVVARSGLGTINHTLLTLAKIREYGLPVVGVVMNGPRNDANAQAVSDYGGVNVIAQVEPIAPATGPSLAAAFQSFFGEWYERHNRELSDMASIHADENSRCAAAR
jgi:dethiobiotin synthetase